MKLNLKRAIEARRNAERDVERYLVESYPIGDPVEWLVGEHRQYGTVVRHAGDRVRVQNHGTGRESWIYAARVL